jgi:hypothetical protein
MPSMHGDEKVKCIGRYVATGCDASASAKIPGVFPIDPHIRFVPRYSPCIADAGCHECWYVY